MRSILTKWLVSVILAIKIQEKTNKTSRGVQFAEVNGALAPHLLLNDGNVNLNVKYSKRRINSLCVTSSYR